MEVEEVRAVTPARSPCASRANADMDKPPRILGNPPPLSTVFTGREGVLQALHAILHTALAPPRAFLQGLDGIGKTQTALAYLYQYQTDYSKVLALFVFDL